MRRWSQLSRVEHVEVYTRVSLLVVLLGTNGYVLARASLDLGTFEAAGLLAGGLAVSALGASVLTSVLRRGSHDPLPTPAIVAMLAVGVGLLVAAAFWDGEARGGTVMAVVVAVTISLGLVPSDRLTTVLVLASTLVVGAYGGDPQAFAAGLFVATVFTGTGRASIWLFAIVRDLDDARQAQSRLAVAEERLRFSRDVHDVLGRRLSTIAVQSELAATLAERGDARAAERMLEVRGVAHQALREARELARGYRSTDFAQELEGARSLLRSAGIEVRLAVEDLPRAWHEAAGWVVRESVTNVLRHSRASLVEIVYADGDLRVANDGATAGAGNGDGAGLRGLRERLVPLGASLEAAADDGSWEVVAHLPGSGPLSATTKETAP